MMDSKKTIAAVETLMASQKDFTPAELFEGQKSVMAKDPSITLKEWIRTDSANPCVVSVGGSSKSNVARVTVRFPLTKRLSTDDLTKAAPQLLAAAGQIDGALATIHERLHLVYTHGEKTMDVSSVVQEHLTTGGQSAKALRDFLKKSYQFDTDAAADATYQMMLGKPVKLVPADMQALSGGNILIGVGSLIVGLVPIGLLSGLLVEEAATSPITPKTPSYTKTPTMGAGSKEISNG